MPKAKHCDDSTRIRAGTRYDPELEEASTWFEPLTEGMCTGTVCRISDMEAWQNSADREFKNLARQTEELEKSIVSKFGGIANAPNDFKAILNKANQVLEAWRVSWENWEPRYEEMWRESLGGIVIHNHAKTNIRDMINQFRDAACVYDEIVLATSEVGGYIPPAEKEQIEEDIEEKRKKEAWKTAVAIGALGVAALFTLKTARPKKGTPKTRI